jgi:GNAT superfamily N-acetyltransferase
VGIGEYLLDPSTNEAEIAFSISKPYQKKGLGKILLHKLAVAARENGIGGLMAYTSAQNRGMIKLFKTLPYKIDSVFDGELLELRCRFDQPL